jgi:thiamine-monophosphate kinase
MRKAESRAGMDEEGLIARFFRPLAGAPGALSLLDDAALARHPAGHEFVVTTDAIVAGVHFFASDQPDAIARKALRVNLSDLAAKGAAPAGFLLTLGLPKPREAWLKRFAGALRLDAKAFACPLLGGDTIKTTGPLFVSITAFGTVPIGAMVQRHGAKPGDRIMVTGTIGDAALGLLLKQGRGRDRLGLTAKAAKSLVQRYLIPTPRNPLSVVLRRHARAAIDVSDGLVGDVCKLCHASGVGAELAVARVPLSAAAKTLLDAKPNLLATVLTGGDDFEIACAIPPDQLRRFRAAAQRANVPVAEIGHVVAKRGVRVTDQEGKVIRFTKTSFSHF